MRLTGRLVMSALRGGLLFGFLLALSIGTTYLLWPYKFVRALGYYEPHLPFAIVVTTLRKTLGGDSARVAAGELGLLPWQPERPSGAAAQGALIGDKYFESPQEAAKAAKPGDTIRIGAGLYQAGLQLRQDLVTIEGVGHVVFDNAAVGGKGAIVVHGHNTVIKNLECRNIKVADGNGACVRMQGKGLTLDNVYFHDSQSGLLADAGSGAVVVRKSRFERLGHKGRAHAIYVGAGSDLLVEDSLVIQSQSDGHEIKSRAETTRIKRSVIASLDGQDSRLIDLPHGGSVTIEDSILEQGKNTSNGELIGFGLEGRLHKDQTLLMSNTTVIVDSRHGATFFADAQQQPTVSMFNNRFIGIKPDRTHRDLNVIFSSRIKAGLGTYPSLPALPLPSG